MEDEDLDLATSGMSKKKAVIAQRKRRYTDLVRLLNRKQNTHMKPDQYAVFLKKEYEYPLKPTEAEKMKRGRPFLVKSKSDVFRTDAGQKYFPVLALIKYGDRAYLKSMMVAAVACRFDFKVLSGTEKKSKKQGGKPTGKGKGNVKWKGKGNGKWKGKGKGKKTWEAEPEDDDDDSSEDVSDPAPEDDLILEMELLDLEEEEIEEDDPLHLEENDEHDLEEDDLLDLEDNNELDLEEEDGLPY